MLQFPDKKYGLILADPPWLYANTLSHKKEWGAATSAYPCMKTADIAALPVPDIADSNCMLALWATGPKLLEAMQVMLAWHFDYVQVRFVWLKVTKGSEHCYLDPDTTFPSLRGYYTNTNAEFVLLGRKGYAPAIYDDTVRQLVFAPRGARGHSQKPPEVHRRLVLLFGDVPRIELFARDAVLGWTTWGLEVASAGT